MTKQERGDFCYGLTRETDGAIAFRCREDVSVHAWLGLHPAHNIAVQATNYYALTGVSYFAGAMDGEKWTALTDFRWRVGDTGDGARHPLRGVARHADDDLRYACVFFDANDNRVYDVSGSGVVFRNRDFEAWRAKAKAEIARLPAPDAFVFAAPEDVGVATPGEVFVTPLMCAGTAASFVDALITEETGFAPAHPYHGGSGDHVNSGHLCDAAQQAAFLAGRRAFPVAGAAKFSRYVELGRPFRLTISEAPRVLTFEISQGPYKCAMISFDYHA